MRPIPKAAKDAARTLWRDVRKMRPNVIYRIPLVDGPFQAKGHEWKRILNGK